MYTLATLYLSNEQEWVSKRCKVLAGCLGLLIVVVAVVTRYPVDKIPLSSLSLESIPFLLKMHDLVTLLPGQRGPGWPA